MHLIITLIFTLLMSYTIQSFIIQKRQDCDNSWAFCLPLSNQTWYHYNNYTFIWNLNNTYFVNNDILIFDLHIQTSLTSQGTERTVKSWYNLTGESLAVQVTDDWFPKSLLPTSNNLTWTMYAFLLPHDTILPSNLDITTTTASYYQPYVQIHVVQLPPIPIIINQEKLAYKWIIAIIVITCVVVIIAIGFMHKIKKARRKAVIVDNPGEEGIQRSSMLTTPDAMMIADTFRQAMSTSDYDYFDKKRSQAAQDLLVRQLESEGTSVSEVERRTSSKKGIEK